MKQAMKDAATMDQARQPPSGNFLFCSDIPFHKVELFLLEPLERLVKD